MIILPIKSRLQIVKERNNPESVWTSHNIILFIAPTPKKNEGPDSTYRAIDFCRLLVIVTKKIHKKAVIRNKFRRRVKEAFKLIDKSLLKNKYDYQILVKQSIFKASLPTIVKDIEDCLTGKAILGIPERTIKKKKNNNNKNKNKVKTHDILNSKLN